MIIPRLLAGALLAVLLFGACVPTPPAPSATRPAVESSPVVLTPGLEVSPALTPASAPVPTTGPVSVGQGGAWQLAFADEFTGQTLDPSRWHTCYWWATTTCSIESNHELELYNPADVLVQDGVLRLRAQRRPMVGWNGNTYAYTSGMVMTGGRKGETPPGFTFTYGYVEAQVRVPRGNALWPAIWMLPASYESDPEINIMEMIGQVPNGVLLNYHWLSGTQGTGRERQSGTTWFGPDFSTDWHTFGFGWSAETMTWYVDGVERWRFTDAASIPSAPMYLVMDLAVGGDWPGEPDASTYFPSYFDVRYVRVWKSPSPLP